MRNLHALLGALATLALSFHVSAQQSLAPQLDDSRFPARNILFQELEDGSILVADDRQQLWFQDFSEYARSSFFQQHGLRCGADELVLPIGRVSAGDCDAETTNPAAQYDPSGANYQVQVVFHVLTRTDGTGDVSDALIHSQIDVLNEDFRAMAGTNGAGGTDTNIQFTLAGITRSANNGWYNDGGPYWKSLAWDTTRYLNVYTNTARGNLGYAFLPNGGGVVGEVWDRVVLNWRAVGRPAPYGAPYDLGRSGTHEVGHYLGLYHTFEGGCAAATAPGCYSSGDLICDTNPEASANSFPCSRTTCGTPDPTNNYMDYSDDACLNTFTGEQARRMRCTLENFRVDLVTAPISLTASRRGRRVSLSWSGNVGGVDITRNGTTIATNVTGSSYVDGSFKGKTSGTYTYQVCESGGGACSNTASVTF